MGHRGDQNAQQHAVVDAASRFKMHSAERFDTFYKKDFSSVVGLPYAPTERRLTKSNNDLFPAFSPGR
jgi:hypothetical protein